MTPRDFRIAASALSVGSIGPGPVWHLVGAAPRGTASAKARPCILEIERQAAARAGLLATIAAQLAAALIGILRIAAPSASLPRYAVVQKTARATER